MVVIWIKDKTGKRINEDLKLFLTTPNSDKILEEMPWDHKINNLLDIYRFYLEGSISIPVIQRG